mmetsp:Transcript_10110/g.24010  ORF Transcript_10110/g.24010 Transcript_10110/m.24010 type:complete len:258 (+) Transcript_10110:225-998(+)
MSADHRERSATSRQALVLIVCTSLCVDVQSGAAPSCLSLRQHTQRSAAILHLRGGHKESCACGEIGDVTDRCLLDCVDMGRIACFNTEQGHGLAEVLRPQCEKDDPSKWLESSDDDQVLMCISFTEHVNLKSLTLTGRGETAPRVVKIFVNKAIDDFEEAERSEPEAEWAPSPAQLRGEEELATPPEDRRFNNVQSLTLFIENSAGGERSCVGWLGLKGEATRLPVKGVVQDTEYELRPSDVHLKGMTQGPRHTTGF